MTTNENLNEKDVAGYWDDNAAMWAEQVRKGWDVYREYLNNPAFLEFIGEVEGKSVLDAGCGEGYNTRILAKLGAEVMGIDISSKLIDYARAHERDEPLGIRYEVASFTNLSLFKERSFSTVISFMAMMDSPDYYKVMKEFYRVLENNGELFFNMLHPCFMTKGLNWLKDENGNETELIVARYFDTRPWVENWKFSNAQARNNSESFSVPYFPQTLSYYVNKLIEAGFVLKTIEEPRPSQQVCNTFPFFRKWRDHASIFFYIHAKKE